MKNRSKQPQFLSFLIWFSIIFTLSCQTKKEIRPNILIFLADDMGYKDLGCYGGEAITPNLDDLAADGIKFTNCYAGAPNCSPSRASLLTGRMPVRAGMYSYRPPNHPMHLRDKEVTIAEVLKKAGYQTAHFGKWHLGCLPQDSELNHPQPDQQGFEYSLGTENNSQPSHHNPDNFVRNGVEISKQEGYASQLLADEIEGWLEKVYNKEKPFFMYVPFHEPHAKVAAPPELVAHYEEYDQKTAEYFACIENMDNAVGRILSSLKSHGLKENTMIFFGSDNGSYRMGSNDPLRGMKGEVYDGGIKVPGIFHWQKVFKGNRESDAPIWFPDLMPTICDLLGIKVEEDWQVDGISLLPLLKDEKLLTRQQSMLWYFYRSSPEIAMRKGNYMLLARVNDTVPRTHHISDIDMPFIKDLQPEFFELYDVSVDSEQQHNLAEIQPEIINEMKVECFALLEDARRDGPFWEGLPTYDRKKARHDKPAEFLKNEQRFLKE